MLCRWVCPVLLRQHRCLVWLILVNSVLRYWSLAFCLAVPSFSWGEGREAAVPLGCASTSNTPVASSCCLALGGSGERLLERRGKPSCGSTCYFLMASSACCSVGLFLEAPAPPFMACCWSMGDRKLWDLGQLVPALPHQALPEGAGHGQPDTAWDTHVALGWPGPFWTLPPLLVESSGRSLHRALIFSLFIKQL